MPVRSDPQTAAAKWQSNLSNSTAAIQRGVNNVTTAPGQKAAQAADKWLARVTASQAKWKANVAAVSLQQWQQSMLNVGIPRVAQGAQAKVGKMQEFMSQFLPYLQAGVAQIDKMPSTTVEDGVARASAMIRYNAKFKKGVTGSGGGA